MKGKRDGAEFGFYEIDYSSDFYKTSQENVKKSAATVTFGSFLKSIIRDIPFRFVSPMFAERPRRKSALTISISVSGTKKVEWNAIPESDQSDFAEAVFALFSYGSGTVFT